MINGLDHWLLDGATSAGVLLTAAFAILLFIRHAARVQRFGELALAGAVAAMLIAAVPGVHRIFLGWPPAPAAAQPVETHSTLHIGLPGKGAARGRLGAAKNVHVPTPNHMPGAIEFMRYAPPWPETLLALYLSGVLLLAGRLALGCALLRRTAARAEALPDSGTPPVRRPCRTPWPWSGDAVIMVSEKTLTPIAFGILKPVILLPKSLAATDPDTTRLAIAHEMSHITRGDTISRALVAAAGALLFYNPLFWILRRRIRLSQEFLADQAAAGIADSPDRYIELMVRLAKDIGIRRAIGFPAAGLIGRRSDFYVRMNRLLADQGETTLQCGRRWALCALAGMTLLMVPASMLTLGAPPAATGAFSGPLRKSRDVRARAIHLIHQGLAYLDHKQNANGAWLGRYGPAVTALVVRGFMEAGISPRDARLRMALRFIEKTRQADGGFYGDVDPAYSTAIVIRTLSMLPRRRYQRQARRGLAFLRGQLKNSDATNHAAAAWYRGSRSSRWLDAETKLGTGGPNGTAANQIAAGLWMSSNALDPTERSDNTILTRYAQISYAQLKSMVYAGLGARDPRVLHISRWIGRHYTLSFNPANHSSLGLYYYYLVFARTLRAARTKSVMDASGARHDWRRDLVRALSRRRRGGGGWVNKRDGSWLEGNPVMATTYAVLALDQVLR